MTANLEESRKGYIFWVRNFCGFIFSGSILLGIYFLHIMKIVYTPWVQDGDRFVGHRTFLVGFTALKISTKQTPL